MRQNRKTKEIMKIFQSSIFRALCAIIIGVLILKFPQDGVTWLTMAVGELFLVSGIIAMVAYWYARKNATDYTITDAQGRVISESQPTFPIVGLGSIILGLVLIIAPEKFVNGLMYVLGAIMILGGIQQLVNLVRARRLGRISPMFWICPCLIIVTGLFVILKPMETAELPLIILGWCSLLYGVTEIINSLKIWRIRKALAKQSSNVSDDALDVSLEDVDAGPVVPSPGND